MGTYKQDLPSAAYPTNSALDRIPYRARAISTISPISSEYVHPDLRAAIGELLSLLTLEQRKKHNARQHPRCRAFVFSVTNDLVLRVSSFRR